MYRFRAIAAAALSASKRNPAAFKPVCYERYVSRFRFSTNAEKPERKSEASGEASIRDFAKVVVGEKPQLGRQVGDADVDKGMIIDAATPQSPELTIVIEAVTNFLQGTKRLSYEDASSIAANARGFARHILERYAKFYKGGEVSRRNLDVFLPKQTINEVLVIFESVGLDLETSTKLSYEHVDIPSMLKIIQLLQDLGIERRNVGTILEGNPVLLNIPAEGVLENVKYLGELGITAGEMVEMFTRVPELLKPDLRVRWTPYLNVLEQHKVGAPAIRRVVRYFYGHMAKLPQVFFMRGISFFHKELNMKNADVTRILKYHPEVLLLDFDRALGCKLTLLKDYGIKGDDLTRIFCRCPSIVGYSIDTLRQKIDFLLSLNVVPPRVRKVLVLYPAFFATSIENKMKPVVACLEDAGIRGWYLRKLVSNRPAIFAIDVKVKLPEILEKLKDLGPAGMVVTLCWGLSEGIEAMKERVKFLQKLGFRDSELVKMIHKDPRILKIAKRGMATKVKYLTNEMGLRKDLLLTHPTFLYSHFDKRIRVRHMVLLLLHKKGILPYPPELSQILFPSNKDFMARYVNPFPECINLVRKHLQTVERLDTKQNALMLKYTPDEKANRALEREQKALALRY